MAESSSIAIVSKKNVFIAHDGIKTDELNNAYKLSDYQKDAHQTLININNNLSTLLQETFQGIDGICHKVRLCLLDAKAPISQIINDQIEKPKSTNSIAEILEESCETDTAKKEENLEKNVKTESAPQSASITPFFTILNIDKKSCESVAVDLNLIKSISSLSRKCTTESLHKSMKKIQEVTNDEKTFSTMVDNIHKKINECYLNYNKSTRKKPSRRLKLTSPTTNNIKITKPQLQQNNPNIVDELENICSDDDEKHLTKIISGCKLDYSQAEVYRKRAITDLHKRMIAQLEANDSLIFFQKLMARGKKHHFNKNDTNEMGRRKSSEKSLNNYLLNEKRPNTSSTNNLKNKYPNSLWFKQCNKEKPEKRKKRTDTKNNNEKYLPQTYSMQSINNKSKKTSSKTDSTLSRTLSLKYQISVKNNQPLTESEKYKLNWMRTKYFQLKQKNLKYLDILDDITKKDLIPLKAEYPRRDCIDKLQDVKTTYLYKLLHANGKQSEKAWNELFFFDCNHQNDEEKKFETIRTTLSKYIFLSDKKEQEEEKFTIEQPQIFTVMPVHVFYDNQLTSMKETNKERINKRAEWSKELPNKKSSNKPVKIVYDPVLRKIEKEIRLASARNNNERNSNNNITNKLPSTSSWSPKNFNKFCRTPPQQRSSTEKIMLNNNKVLAEIFKRPSKIISNQKIESKKKIQKELEAQVTAKIKKSQQHQRKIWENKYGKSVGQKLLNFIEKQPEPYRLPTPKYALPKPINNKESTNIHHYDEHYTMLNQLKGLKQKNDNIQNNIQKAINVIENKMVDILEKPTTTESIKAFNEMEMEITNVLNLMKPGNSGSEKLVKLEENDVDYDDDDDVDISQELFKKLDRILEIPTSPKNRDKLSYLKHNQKKLENDMNKVSFNTTSTSGEEKFTITAISPKKKVLKNLKTNNSKNVQVEKEQKIINVALIEPQHLEENLLNQHHHHQAIKNKIDDNNNSIKNTINKLEISEQFFTPQTSPINGERIVDDLLKKTEEENETISDSASANISSNCSNNNNTTSVSILSNNSSEPQHKESLFYENVNRIISRVESVYNQLGIFEEEMPKKSPPKVFQDLNEVVQIPSKEFLTPFMNAVKNMKENSPSSSSCKKLMQKSPSYFNVLTFLDTLSDLKEELKGADVVYTSRVVETAYGWNIPLTFYRTVQQNQIELLLEDIPNKKKSGCLKKPSSLLNVNTTQSKSKQKVSFLLKKIEKSTQVSTTQEDSTPCSDFHQLKTNSFSSCGDFSSTESTKKDQQINVCIINNKSLLYKDVDDDDDETYLDSNSKEIIIPQMTSDLDNNKKNVVELFRNNVSDNKHIEDKVKIFYDNFYKDSDSKLISEGGYYNESSIVKVKERLSLDEKLKKINSLNKFFKKEQIHIKEAPQLLEPIRNLNQFIDTKLLRAIILNRQKIRMMIHKKNLEKFSQQQPEEEEERENENFLKGIYVLVYILMFAALNLEYKCL